MKQRWLVFAVVAVLTIPLVLFGLLSSQTGSHWLLMQVLPLLPGQVSLQHSQGRFIDHIELTGLSYRSDAADVDLQTLVLDWQPRQLLSGKLRIMDLHLDGLNVHIKPSPPTKPSSPFDANADLLLPVQIQIDRLLVANAEIKTGDSVQAIEKLQLSLATENGQLNLSSLELAASPINAKLQGQVKLGQGFPLTANAEWQVNADNNGIWQGSTKLTGNLKQLNFSNQLTSPLQLSLNGVANEVLATPTVNITGTWQALQWPVLGDKPQIKTGPGQLSVTGTLDNYKLGLQTQLSQADLPKADLLFNGHGNQNALSIDSLTLSSTAGLLQIAGQTSWQNGTAFDLSASGKHFNPALLSPELPGNLNFAIHVQGQLDSSLSLAAEIQELSGQLRNYPVHGNGKLRLNGQELQADALTLNVGKNKLAVNGKMDQQQAALDFSVNAPMLSALWPTLTGNLQGQGHLQGSWNKPNVSVQVKGKQLGFAKQRLEQLAVDVAYYADNNKASTLLITANDMDSGGLHIKKLQLNGQGSLDKHSFNLDVASNVGELTTQLAGHYQNSQWQGEISKLSINRAETGLWQLKQASKASFQQAPAGWHITLAETCLQQAHAELCSQGNYNANTDFQVQVNASSIPASLLKPYLPEHIKLNTHFNADAQLQQKQGVLAGHYKLAMLPATLSLASADKTLDLALGSSQISGQINASKILADLDLQLLGQDYVRGQLQFDTGKSQTLAGHISATVNEFAWLQAFVPQLSGLKGHLNANLGVNGNMAKPNITGQASLSQGNMELAEAGLGLGDINLQLGSQGRSMQLQLSAAPRLLPNSPLQDQLKLQGLFTLQAQLEQHKQGIKAEYQLKLPANSITVLQPSPKPLGAIDLSGHVDGDQHNVELTGLLVGKDFIKGQLQLNTGKAKTLSGQLHASIDELGLLAPFIPDVSNIKGHVSADLGVEGTLTEPLASGSVSLDQGTVEVNSLGLKITGIKFQALAPTTANGQIQLSGFAKSGAGTLNMEGFIGLAKQPAQLFEIHVTGDNFEIAKLPEAEIAISPDLKFANPEGKSIITGTVKVPKAILKIEDLPDNAVMVSKDEVIIGQEQQPTKAAVPAIDANVVIELGKQVSFSGQGLQTNLSGKLVVMQSNGKLAMYGNVAMDKGRYKSYGQDLTIRKGRFVFNGPVENPWLEVEAIRLSKDKKVTAILSVTGSLNTPKTQVSADPAMPETDALAYLVTGRGLNQVSKSESNMLASAALSYGAGKASWLTSKLGIDEFDIEEGQTLKDSLVSVGQYLTPDFYVGTKVGLFNKQATLILKYMLTEHINVETQTGSTKRIKLNYEYDRN